MTFSGEIFVWVLLVYLLGMFFLTSILLGRLYWRLLRDIGQLGHYEVLKRVQEIDVFAQWGAIHAYLGFLVALGYYLNMQEYRGEHDEGVQRRSGPEERGDAHP